MTTRLSTALIVVALGVAAPAGAQDAKAMLPDSPGVEVARAK